MYDVHREGHVIGDLKGDLTEKLNGGFFYIFYSPLWDTSKISHSFVGVKADTFLTEHSGVFFNLFSGCEPNVAHIWHFQYDPKMVYQYGATLAWNAAVCTGLSALSQK